MKLKLNFINDKDNSIYTLTYNLKYEVPADIKIGDEILLPNNCISHGSVVEIKKGFKKNEMFMNVRYV